MTVKALFFDANGILYSRAPGHPHFQQFLETHQVLAPAPDVLRRATQEAQFQACSGAIAQRQLYEAVMDLCHVSDSALRAEGCLAQARDDEDILLTPGVTTTLPALQARGVRLGIITNTASSTERKLRWFRERGLDLVWNVFANSAELGIQKPQPEIYQWALDYCGVVPQEAAFVGHSVRELHGAKQVGMVTVALFPDPGAQADYVLLRFADLLDLSALQTASPSVSSAAL